MATFTTHKNSDGTTGTVDWPEWFEVKQANSELLWEIILNIRSGNDLSGAQAILKLVTAIREQSGLKGEQLAGARNQQQRRDEIIKEFIKSRMEEPLSCGHATQIDTSFFRCQLGPEHLAKWHAAMRGENLRIWPASVDE